MKMMKGRRCFKASNLTRIFLLAHGKYAEETATSQEAAGIAPRYGLSPWRALRFAFHWRLRETLCAGLRCFPGAKSTYKNGEINRSERVTRDDFEFRASRMAS